MRPRVEVRRFVRSPRPRFQSSRATCASSVTFTETTESGAAAPLVNSVVTISSKQNFAFSCETGAHDDAHSRKGLARLRSRGRDHPRYRACAGLARGHSRFTLLLEN